MGRPKIEIDFKTLDGMCAINCTQEEIASVLGISIDTLGRRIKEIHDMTFAEYYKKNSANGKMSLRRAQFDRAMGDKVDEYKDEFNEKTKKFERVKTGNKIWANNGSVPMLIWLGKQWLGQSEQIQITETELASGFEISEFPSVQASE